MDWHVERRAARISEAMITEAQLSGATINRALNDAQKLRAETLLGVFRGLGSGLRIFGRLPRPAGPFVGRSTGGGDCPACG